MPLASTFGVASDFGWGGQASSLRFVLSTLTGLAFETPQGRVSLSGASAGDLAIIQTFNDADGDFTSLSGWVSDNTSIAGRATQLYSKVLTSGDIAAGDVVFGGASGAYHANSYAALFVYRGARAVTVKSTTSGSSVSKLTLAGFAKAAGARGVLSIVFSYNAVTPATPAGFTSRLAGTANAAHVSGADLDAASYVNGANVTWSGLGGGAAFNFAYLTQIT